MTNPDDLLDSNEAAVYLGCSRRTLYAEFDRGRLRMTKVGRLTRWKRSELDRYLRAGERRRAGVA